MARGATAPWNGVWPEYARGIRDVDAVRCSRLRGSSNRRPRFYSVPRRKFYQRAIAALESFQAKESPFTVFQKVRSNMWNELGWFVVKDAVHNEKDLCLELIPIPTPSSVGAHTTLNQ